MVKTQTSTTGIAEIDRLTGGVMDGDNIVWEMDSGAPFEGFVSSFISVCEQEQSSIVYVSFNRSPQTIAGKYGARMSQGRFILIDCFASGKGNGDRIFLDFFTNPPGDGIRAVHVTEPSDPGKLQGILTEFGAKGHSQARYIFDSLTGMLDLWGDEDRVIRFFGHICPRLYDLSTIAYWLLERQAHTESFLAKVRHITQVVLELSVGQGVRTLTVRKASNRRCSDIGVPRRLEMEGEQVRVVEESREGRELGILGRMGELLGSARALDLNFFFEQTVEALAKELGMERGTLVLLDKATDKLRIAAARGLTESEIQRGEYRVGEGVTGHVVKTGEPEVVPDIDADSRFLNRTAARNNELGRPIAFICVPIKVDDEVVGALSVDRPYAVEATLDKDLRLLTIVASIVSQVIRINRMAQVETDEILARDRVNVTELRSRYRLDNVVGESEAMRRMLGIAATAAKSRASVLITGETGTGKELVANVVHYNSDRAAGPLVTVSCGALPEGLLESELFGHVKGAFTGAVRDRKGRFETADGGTLFLDEVAEMSPRLQVKLLRVLQEREFEPVGSDRTVSVDVRLVTATNKDLRQEVKQGRFREDLFYRLNVIPIQLPPLRARREDIPLLVNHFLEKYNRQYGKSVKKMSRRVLYRLLEHPWPGNVRELENCIEQVVVMSPGQAFAYSLLPAEIQKPQVEGPAAAPKSTDAAGIKQVVEHFCASAKNLAQARKTLEETVEAAVIRAGLDRGLSQRDLADRIGMSRMTLRKRMRKFGLR